MAKSKLPRTGCMVTISGIHSNGSSVHPAVVTRVWDIQHAGKTLVNLTIFPDNASPFVRGSVPFYPNADAANLSDDPVSCYP